MSSAHVEPLKIGWRKMGVSVRLPIGDGYFRQATAPRHNVLKQNPHHII